MVDALLAPRSSILERGDFDSYCISSENQILFEPRLSFVAVELALHCDAKGGLGKEEMGASRTKRYFIGAIYWPDANRQEKGAISALN
jgi:hypothetical protein